jgi:predicted N-acyltransferase
MARVPVRISATIVDEWGIEASTALYATADDSQTLAGLDGEVSAFVTALDNSTDGVIKQARVTVFPVLPTGIKATAAAGSRVEQTGEIGFLATGSAKRYTAAIPALSNGATVLAADRIVLNVVDPIGLLIKILTTLGTVLHWTNEHYQEIQKFLDALVAYRKKRKQLQRSSFEVA